MLVSKSCTRAGNFFYYHNLQVDLNKNDKILKPAHNKEVNDKIAKFQEMAQRLRLRSFEMSALQDMGYNIIKKIARGGYGTVHLAEYRDASNPTQNMRRACKIYDKEDTTQHFWDEYISREVAILCKIKHSHIIEVHDIIESGPRLFIFMSYAENGDLQDFIDLNGEVSENLAKLWFRQIASGLEYLHKNNIAHRDLKSKNILLTRRFQVKLADFGLATFCTDHEKILSFCGTPMYAAPEVLSKTPNKPKVADVWSLGIVLYFMLNATVPFKSRNRGKLIEDQMTRNWVFRLRIRDIVSPAVRSLVRRIVEPNPSLRLTLDRVLSHEWTRSRTNGEASGSGDHKH